MDGLQAATEAAVSATELGEGAAPLRFSTEAVPPRERMAHWRDTFGRTIVKVEMDPLDSEPYRCDAAFHLLPGLIVTEIETDPVRLTRTRALAADGSDEFVLFMQRSGRCFVSQLGREAVVERGDAGLMLNEEPGRTVMAGENRTLSLSVPRASIEPMLSSRDLALTRVIPGSSPALRLLAQYVELIWRDGTLAAPELNHAIAAHLRDLIALAVGATRDSHEQACGRGVRVARLRAVKEDIARHLGCADLSVRSVAARQGVSPRYVGMLFEAEGTSFSTYVLAARLALAHHRLTDPAASGVKISTIAYDLGFGDLSYFNRSFRRRYGATPSDVRAAVRADTGAARSFGDSGAAPSP